MIHLNDEEIDRLHSKLYMLEVCCDVLDLGFKYNEDDCIIIDQFAGEGGYSGYTEIDMIATILEPTIEDGEINMNHEGIDLLKEISAEIPYSTYDENSVTGFYIHIDNYITKKFIKYKLTPDEHVSAGIKRLNQMSWYNESSIDVAQVIFRENGLYIVYPEEYTCIEEYVDSYLYLLGRMKFQVEEYESSLEREAA